LEIEVSQITTTKKVGRRSNCNQREKEADRDKEFCIQTNMEEVFNKDGNGGKYHPSKGQSHIPSHPSKVGASKSSSK